VVLIIETTSTFPLPRPLLHTVAVIEPDVQKRRHTERCKPGHLPESVSFLASLGHRGLRRPAPDSRSRSPHRYRFHVFALDEPIPQVVTTAKALLKQMAGTRAGPRRTGPGRTNADDRFDPAGHLSSVSGAPP